MKKTETKMLKFTLRIILITALSVVVTVFLLAVLLSLCVPSTMAKLTENLGMYGISANYYYREYEYTNEIKYSYSAFTNAVTDNDQEKIIKFGTGLIQDKEFDSFAQEIDKQSESSIETCKQYVYGRIGIAYYLQGEAEKGIDLTISVNQTTFDKYNAVTDLVYKVVYVKGDKVTTEKIRDELLELKEQDTIEKAQDEQNLLQLLLTIESFLTRS